MVVVESDEEDEELMEYWRKQERSDMGLKAPERVSGEGTSNQMHQVMEVDEGVKSYSSSITGSGSKREGATFGPMYIQCKAARTSELTTNCIDTSFGTDCMNKSTVSKGRVGSFEQQGEADIKKTFHGSRVNSGDAIVNQNITMSFDPATLICLQCDKPHSILNNSEQGVIIAVSDQNFMPIFPSKDTCFPIIRLEDGTLDELSNLVLEVLEKQVVPPGTLFLISSVSYLAKVGTTIYCQEWVRVCSKLTSHWLQIKIGPLPPMIKEDTLSMLGKLLIELVSWYDRVYGASIVYSRAAWHKVIDQFAYTDEQGLDLGHSELYIVALPRTILDRSLVPYTFKYSSSHTATHGMDSMATHELLRTLLSNLSTDFGFIANLEGPSLEEPVGQQGTVETKPDKIIIIGASHGKRLYSALSKRNIDCIDLTIPGWAPTAENIEALLVKISELGIVVENCYVVLDVLSNIVFRFEQYDGSLSLPFKSNGVYHMGGKVMVCSREIILNTLSSTKELFLKFPGTKIVTLPIPRFLFAPCCARKGHCAYAGSPSLIAATLESTLGLRKHIQDGLIKAGITNFVVPDLLQQVLNEKSDIKVMGNNLKALTSQDNVHLTPEGYNKIADVIINVIEDKKSAAIFSVSGPVAAPKSGFYWRGFMSPVGTTRAKHGATTYKQARVGGGKWRGGGHHWNEPVGGAALGRGGYRGSGYRR